MSAGDDLLTWASEAGSGSWSSLRDTAAYLSRVHEAVDRPWYLAAPLSDLGHIDISWTNQRWSVAPPALAIARGTGFCAYLVGSRPKRMAERFLAAADELDVYPFEIAQGNAPNAVFAKCAGVDAAMGVAERLKVPLLFDPSTALAEAVAVVDTASLELGAPPPMEDTLEVFKCDANRWVPTDDRVAHGLYRTDLYGRNIYRLHRGDEWFKVDRAIGQLLVLRDTAGLLRWSPPSRDWRIPSALEVPSWLALPQLAERAAVAASGLLPIRSQGKRLFRNVTRIVASIVSERLGVQLSVSPSPSSGLTVPSP
jgi:hypothetical protein